MSAPKKRHPRAKVVRPLSTLFVRSFRVDARLADNFVCGGANGGFTTSLEVTARELTDEGFVVEVKSLMDRVKEAFDADGEMLKASCEELAAGVANIAIGMTGKRCECCSVQVRNMTGTVMLRWKKGEAIPAFPRRATFDEEVKTKKTPQSRSMC